MVTAMVTVGRQSRTSCTGMHPFAPLDQAKGYAELITSLEDILCELTGFPGGFHAPPLVLVPP